MPNTKQQSLSTAIIIREYEKLTAYAEKWASGHFNLVVLVGGGGIGKSKTVRNAVGKKALWIEGTASAFGMYQALFHNRGKLVVIDDVDKLYTDANSVRLLKCLCQTDPVKHLSWHTGAAGVGKEVPKEFTTTSKVIIIANDWKRLNENVGALESRGHLLRFRPSPVEIHRKAAEFFWDQSLFDALGRQLHLFPGITLRTYLQAAELKDAGMDWLDVLYREGYDEQLVVVAKLLHDERFKTESERAIKFKEICGCARATYFRHKKKLQTKKRIEVPQLRLRRRKRPQPATGRLHLV